MKPVSTLNTSLLNRIDLLQVIKHSSILFIVLSSIQSGTQNAYSIASLQPGGSIYDRSLRYSGALKAIEKRVNRIMKGLIFAAGSEMRRWRVIAWIN